MASQLDEQDAMGYVRNEYIASKTLKGLPMAWGSPLIEETRGSQIVGPNSLPRTISWFTQRLWLSPGIMAK